MNRVMSEVLWSVALGLLVGTVLSIALGLWLLNIKGVKLNGAAVATEQDCYVVVPEHGCG